MTGARENLLVVLPTGHGGGAEFVGRTWARSLQERGWAATVVTYDDHEGRGLDGLDVTALHGRGLRRLTLPLQLRRLVKEQRPSVIVSLLTFSNLLTIVACTGLGSKRPKVFISERNIPQDTLRGEGLGGRLQLPVCRLLYRRADGLLAISHPVAAACERLMGGSDRIRLVPNPVLDLATPSPVWEGASDLRIGFVGRFVPQKQPGLVLETAAELRRTGVPATVTFVGSGPLESELLATAERLGVPTVIEGWVERWTEHLPAAVDVLLLPSAHEGFGNVLVEAAAAGLPSVAPSSALGVGDALIPGVTGVLAGDDRPATLAASVLAAARIEVPGQAVLGGWFAWFSTEHSTDRLLEAIRG